MGDTVRRWHRIDASVVSPRSGGPPPGPPAAPWSRSGPPRRSSDTRATPGRARAAPACA